MKNIFPTFEEIDQGYCVYLLHDYKGLDDNGNPKYSEKLDMEVEWPEIEGWAPLEELDKVIEE